MSNYEPVKIRVAAYFQLGQKEQSESGAYKAQMDYYTALIDSQDIWESAGIYYDLKLATKAEGRPELNRLLGECRAGKVDLIITKSLSGIENNVQKLLGLVKELSELDPPVGVYFESVGINTLSSESTVILKSMLLLAEDESKNKHHHLPFSDTFESFRRPEKNSDRDRDTDI